MRGLCHVSAHAAGPACGMTTSYMDRRLTGLEFAMQWRPKQAREAAGASAQER